MPSRPMSGPRRGTSPSRTVPANTPPQSNLVSAAPTQVNPQPTPPTPPLPPPAPTPAQPISFNGGKQSYNPVTAPFGFDQSTPGMYEQLFQNNQNLWLQSPQQDWVMAQLPTFQDPWAGQREIESTFGDHGPRYTSDYWAGVQGKNNTPVEDKMAAGYTGPNNAQTAFDLTKSQLPGSFQPQFDAYYDRMHDKVMSDVNSQSAARGAYGSNTALNNSIGAGLDVEAQRSKALTDFMLEDSANQRAWLDSLGTQGRNADLSGVDIFGANEKAARYGLDKTVDLGNIAFNADKADAERDRFELDRAKTAEDLQRERLDAGISTAVGSESQRQGQLHGLFGSALTAQNAQENRVNNLQNTLAHFSSDVQDFVNSYYDQLIGGDKQVTDQELQTMIAQAADERGWDQYQQERIFRDAKTAIDAINGKKTADASKGGTG